MWMTPRRVKRYPVLARGQSKRLLMYCAKNCDVPRTSGAAVRKVASTITREEDFNNQCDGRAKLKEVRKIRWEVTGLIF
jgi:hypothetical protein